MAAGQLAGIEQPVLIALHDLKLYTGSQAQRLQLRFKQSILLSFDAVDQPGLAAPFTALCQGIQPGNKRRDAYAAGDPVLLAIAGLRQRETAIRALQLTPHADT